MSEEGDLSRPRRRRAAVAGCRSLQLRRSRLRRRRAAVASVDGAHAGHLLMPSRLRRCRATVARSQRRSPASDGDGLPLHSSRRGLSSYGAEQPLVVASMGSRLRRRRAAVACRSRTPSRPRWRRAAVGGVYAPTMVSTLTAPSSRCDLWECHRGLGFHGAEQPLGLGATMVSVLTAPSSHCDDGGGRDETHDRLVPASMAPGCRCTST